MTVIPDEVIELFITQVNFLQVTISKKGFYVNKTVTVGNGKLWAAADGKTSIIFGSKA